MSFALTLLLAFLLLLAVVAGMAIGVVAGRRPISGSCGGLGAGGCELCRGECREDEPSSDRT